MRAVVIPTDERDRILRRLGIDAGTGTQGGEADRLGTPGPAENKQIDRKVPDGTLADGYVPVVYFRDAAGLRWTVLPDGRLAAAVLGLMPGASLIATTALSQSTSLAPDRP